VSPSDISNGAFNPNISALDPDPLRVAPKEVITTVNEMMTSTIIWLNFIT
jgi:hypothetical protein